MPEAFCGMLLVFAHLPAILFQCDLMRLTIDVAGEVLSRPAKFEERLFEVTAL
ncbi:unannotated protein [freshwater metagenome]|uniref:Unannotated protein n=1 Tax=freshwater metagenome TaxID=449393 RepID=A0A6J6E8A9_9ZZZZ